MFYIIEEDSGDTVQTYEQLGHAKNALLMQPEGLYIYDEDRNCIILTEDGGMSWVYEPQGVEAMPQTVPTDPTRAKWARDYADYQEWFAQQEGLKEETVDRARLERGYYRVASDVSVGMPPIED